MKNLYVVFVIAAIAALTYSCNDKTSAEYYYYTEEEQAILSPILDIPMESPMEYDIELPGRLSNFMSTSINDAQATLGRVLFYDKALSRNETVSCASCHDQKHAFADPIALSEGFEGKPTLRNSYAIGTVVSTNAYYGNSNSFLAANGGGPLFWDGRAATVADQSRETLQNLIEMGMDLDDLEERLSQKPHYPILFAKAYESPEITKEKVLESLQEFILSFTSFSSKLDEAMAKMGTTGTSIPDSRLPGLTDEEALGQRIFVKNCNTCHGSISSSFASLQQSNNGLEMDYADKGIARLTQRSDDMDKFKVPNLRNIALTGPYMHDGRFETLEEVVEHYNSGIKDHRNLDPRLRENWGGEPLRLNLTAEEKKALVAFLKTTTDYRFIQEEKWSDPFLQ